MTRGIGQLLELASWRAFDVDTEGRVLAGSDESGSTQLVEFSAEGTATPLTTLPGAVSGKYLPGVRRVIVEHDTDGDERGQLSSLHLDRPRPGPVGLDGLEPLVHDSRYVHRLLDVLPGRVVYATNRRNGVDFDVILRSAVTGEEQVIYDRGGLVTSVAASPDSRYLALTIPAREPMSDQLIVVNTMPETESEHVLELTSADEHASHGQVAWLPDDSGLIVTTNSGREHTGIARFSQRGESRQWLVSDEQHDLTGWLSPDGSTLLVFINVDGATRIRLHEAKTGEQRHEITLAEQGWCGYPLPAPAWSPDSRSVVFTLSTPTAPGDVLVLDTEGGIRSLTNSTAQSHANLVRPTTHLVENQTDQRIPCFVYTPPEPDPAMAGSSVLYLHGGPESQSVHAFNPIVQGLVTQGHTVLVPNVRGSLGYGKRWYSADDQRQRLAAVDDLAALHDWLPSLGLDQRRSALWGGSYGGYLVLAGMAFQPSRWAAGVDVVGISALTTFLRNTASYRRAHREREYGSLDDDAEFLREASPLTHAGSIGAPLLAIHGANDPRVPLTEAEQIVAAVAEKGIQSELLVYPDEGHGLAKRENREHAYTRAAAFLAEHLTS